MAGHPDRNLSVRCAVSQSETATLRRPAVHEVTAGAFAVVSVELQVKVFMPPIVADPKISFLRRCAYMKRHEERAAEQRDELAASYSEHWASCHWLCLYL
jgi:hypothetical protein